MKESPYKVYRYRWIVLAFYSFVQAVTQLLWLTFAPITGEAATHYGVTPLKIGLLSACFMFVLTFLSIPSAWIIDRFGIRRGVGCGVFLIGLFALTRGFFGMSYNWVLASMIGIAIGQPFVVNSVTTIAAKWFPIEERATVTGIAILFQFVGITIGMAATPLLTVKYGIPGMLKIYGVVTALASVCFLVFVREEPPTLPAGSDIVRSRVSEGLKRILSQRDMILVIILFFVGLGIYNALSTWIEQMIAPRGFTMIQAGTLGAVLMIGGIIGCLVIPPLSDRFQKRKAFIVLCVVITLPGLIGLTFATDYALLLISGFVMGFFFMSSGPVIFQYSAEISYPAPEATSQSLLNLVGQVSGIIFIFGMDRFRSESGSMTPFLLVMIALATINIVLASKLKESRVIDGR